ncbi:MAG TPA: ABC transporter permease [Fimbriiglobus sp.]|jgi:ABC-type multidrug transport system permease subunit
MTPDRPSSPLWQLTISRFKEFLREPAALFWVYGFPILLCVILGLAFRNRPVEKMKVDVPAGMAGAEKLVDALKNDPQIDLAKDFDEATSRNRLRTATTTLVILPIGTAPGYEYLLDPTRPDCVHAKNAAEAALLRYDQPNRTQPKRITFEEPGGRYIDFLIPGLIGMNLMGGGLFGIGFLFVDMRVKKLLKRLLATPMRKRDLFLSVSIGRFVFVAIDILFFLTFAYIAFDIKVRGNWLALVVMVVLGAFCFSGIGLLIGSRASRMEVAAGLMNAVMMPSWLLCGVFFSAKNYPDTMQPFIQALPLTALNNGLRAVINDGAGFESIWLPVLILLAWTVASFAVGKKLFKWN